MTATRDRLRALANDPTFIAGGRGRSHPDVAEAIALAAYRMAIEDAAKACDKRAIVVERNFSLVESDEASRCAAAVRALAEQLDANE